MIEFHRSSRWYRQFLILATDSQFKSREWFCWGKVIFECWWSSFSFLSVLCVKHKGQFLLKPDVPLPHLVFSFLQWRDRKLNSGAYDVLLNVIQGESRWYCDDEHTFIHVYSVLCLAWHPFLITSTVIVIPMVPVVWTQSVFHLVGVFSWRWRDLWLQLQSADPGASDILSRVQVMLSDSQVITLQVFSFSAGPGHQLGGALAVSLAVITYTHPFIKHTQISYVGNL